MSECLLSDEMSSELSTLKSCFDINKNTGSKKCDDVVRPLCTICHDRSSGFHYGTHACEGCKGFFRRMVTNTILAQSMLQCTGTNKDYCDINSVTRNNCQRCRLQKCFQMGMTRHKTRLGRRTKASINKIECRVSSHFLFAILTDEEMTKSIKRESRYFNNNDSDDDDEPLGKCIKHKAKLYSQKYSKCYSQSLKIEMKQPTISSDHDDHTNYASNEQRAWKKIFNDDDACKEELSCIPDERGGTEIKRFGHDSNIFGISDFDIGDSRTMDFTQNFLSSLSPTSNATTSSSCTSDGSAVDNTSSAERIKPRCNGNNSFNRTPLFESIRLNTEKLQIDQMCMKIRIFLSYDLDNENYMLLRKYKKVMSTLNQHVISHNKDRSCDSLTTNRLHNIKCATDSQMIFNEVKSEMIDMCNDILGFFRKIPDVDLFKGPLTESTDIQKKIIQTLAIWMIKFVNVSESFLYNPRLSMKIPFYLLTQSPLKHFFETLFHLADIANSILSSKFDDIELSFLSILVVTFPKKGFIHCSENMLQSDSFLKVRFIYSALLYEYLFAEKFHQNIDHTENQLQKFCWLINQSFLLQDRDVAFMFCHLNL